MPLPEKLTNEQRDIIAQRFSAGETQAMLADEFNVSVGTIRKVCIQRNAVRVAPIKSTSKDLTEFASRVRSVLWRQDHGSEKKTYEAWQARVAALESKDGGGYTKNEAIVRASKEYPCLYRLFREYDVSEFDPNPESHPEIQYFGKNPGAAFADCKVVCEGKEQTYRESLRWAIEAAGAHLRTGKGPETCPNDTAWYLYRQAIEEPKDFLGKVGQIESKGDGDSEEKRNSRRASQRSIAEIDSFLAELNAGEEND